MNPPTSPSGVVAWRMFVAVDASASEVRAVVLATIARQLPKLSAEDVRELCHPDGWRADVPAPRGEVKYHREPEPEPDGDFPPRGGPVRDNLDGGEL